MTWIRCAMYCARITWFVIWAVVTIGYITDFILAMIDKGLENKYRFGIIFVFYILFSIMFLWSYYVVCWGNPGNPEQFYKDLGIYDRIMEGNIPTPFDTLPLCPKCGLPKPPRTHHCSVCNKCSFRFDHHCPVIGNCIALYNIKAFILFPFYGGLVIIMLGIQVAFHYTWLISVIIFPIGLGVAFGTTNWCGSIISNETTLETIANNKEENYSKGCRVNYAEIYSPWYLYLLPTRPQVSGFHWCEEFIRYQVQKFSLDNPDNDN